jgi:transcriptional regulator with XRE-family HTH domain
VSVVSKIKLLAKLRKKAYRDAYVEEHVKTSLPFQIRTMREQPERNWSQAELGSRAGMRQNAISRLEKADYGNLNVNTLLRLASAFDVALLIKFVPFRKLMEEFSDLSTQALEVPSFDFELPVLEDFAESVVTTVTTTTRTQALADLPKITVQDFIEANRHWFTSGPDLETVYDDLIEEEEVALLPGFFKKGSSTDTPLVNELTN